MNDRMKLIALVGVLAITLLVIVGFMYGLIAERDLATYAPTLVGFAVPVITTLLAAIGISKELGTIHGKVNGNYESAIEQITKLQEQVNQFSAVAPPEVASQIVNTEGIPIVPIEEYGREDRA